MTWPVSPVNGQQLTVNGQTFVYDSALGVWNRLFATTLTNVAVSGSNTQVQFNDGNSSFGASTTFTFNKNANTLTLQGNANITNLLGNVISTTVTSDNANIGNITGVITVASSSQPNITSVGTLTGLNISGYTTFFTSQDTFSTITGATGTVTHNTLNGAIFYHTTPAANFTPNFTNVPTANNYATVVTLFINQGATAYMPTSTANVQVNSVNVTVKWLGQTAPSGTASGVDMITYSIIRAADAWTVLGQGGGFS